MERDPDIGSLISVTRSCDLRTVGLKEASGSTAGALGSFLMEGAKSSFPDVSLVTAAQMKQLSKDLQKQ